MRHAQSRFHFDRYTLIAEPLRLLEGHRHVEIAQRPLEVLFTLLEAGGQTLSKETLMQRVWRGTHVDMGNLTQAIFVLRRTLGERKDGGEFIETVPREGYRFAPVALSAVNPHPVGLVPMDPAKGSSDSNLFQLLVESIEDYAIYVLDCAGRVKTWNAGAERCTGFRGSEILGRHFSAFFLPEDIAAGIPQQELMRASRHNRYQGEGWRMRKSGERFWASSSLTTMRSPDGRLLGFAKVIRDLTERKRHEDALLRMEEQLRRERDRLSAAAESSLDALFLCEAVRDPQGEIEDFVFTYLNSNVERMLALPRNVLLGGHMCQLLPFNRSLGLFDRYKGVVDTREPYVDEFRIKEVLVTSDWVRVQALPLGDGLVITASDITARKHAELRVAELTKHLEELQGKASSPLVFAQGIHKVGA